MKNKESFDLFKDEWKITEWWDEKARVIHLYSAHPVGMRMLAKVAKTYPEFFKNGTIGIKNGEIIFREYIFDSLNAENVPRRENVCDLNES